MPTGHGTRAEPRHRSPRPPASQHRQRETPSCLLSAAPAIRQHATSCVYSMHMARVNVYLPDELAEQSRVAGLNVSGLAQDAIRRALDTQNVNDWLDDLASLEPVDVDYRLVKQAMTRVKDDFGL